ncbi:DEAD/DEAH box helicase [Candidatus Dojkabacteria bacterium]|nr:DEAD/DEAH box helicase [Candidatus Dojkabacteria bacterium]
MSSEIEGLIASHPSTKELIKYLKEWANIKPARFVLIKGFFLHFQKPLFHILEQVFKKKFIFLNYATRENIRYLKSLNTYSKTTLKFSVLKNTLIKSNFSNQSKVYTKRDFSIKGDTISFWPIELDNPVRAIFFGEEIEELEVYDSIYGTRIKRIEELVLGDLSLAESDNFINISSDNNKIFKGACLSFSDEEKRVEDKIISFDFQYPQLFFHRFDLLKKEIIRLIGLSYKPIIYTKHKNEIPKELRKYVVKSDTTIESGFYSKDLKTIFITDRELFGTIFLVKKGKESDSTKFLRQLEGEIKVGSYLVHEDYGVAIYGGITQEPDNKQFILLKYAEGDELLVPLNQAHKLTKYIAPTDKAPQITRLGKGMWNRLKTKIKKSIGLLARELLEGLAKREISKVSPIDEIKTEAYKDFSDKFAYEETEDQLVAIRQIEEDLMKERPMNRLIVGDVGFGKTEVFMRAAFRIIESGQQVAILAPTTVLVAQHYSVLKERFRGFPVRIASLSRFGLRQENSTAINKINSGEIDIVVGTHRLLSNDVSFKNLGLIVIDEEQKFGVKQKEILKNLNTQVHTITLSASPIPRTLSMALSQILDISIITTPPRGRKPIKTNVVNFAWTKLIDAITFELKRGGQVYFVHNEVRTIDSMKAKLQGYLPSLRIAIGHGQMEPAQLEKVMEDFYNKKYDVLLCTTIIENGLDMPNVNTLIVNNAQNFGLAQLYQLRGRVGRSDEQAYAHLLYSHKSERIEEIVKAEIVETEEYIEKKKPKGYKADQRLQAIHDLQELGSGFSLASRDLEIRGAGNILGKEQHGNILNIGLGLYMQLLNEEIERLKMIKRQNN